MISAKPPKKDSLAKILTEAELGIQKEKAELEGRQTVMAREIEG